MPFPQQRKVSLSTLQSKAAKRRDIKNKEIHKAPKPKKKPKEAKVNGFTNEPIKDKDNATLINSEQIEMEPIEIAVEVSNVHGYTWVFLILSIIFLKPNLKFSYVSDVCPFTVNMVRLLLSAAYWTIRSAERKSIDIDLHSNVTDVKSNFDLF